MHAAVFIVGIGLLAIAAVATWWREPLVRARRLLRRAPEKRLGALVDGERARVRGHAVAPREGALVAPFTGRACIAYRFVGEEHLGRQWHPVVQGEACVPFELAVDGLVARIEGTYLLGLETDARGGDDEAPSPRVIEAWAALKVPLRDAEGVERRLRFREAVLADGDPIWVLGRASVAIDASGQPDALRGPPIRRVIIGSEGAPTVVADEHGQGELLPFE